MFFLGRDKGRLQIINELAERLTTLGCKLDLMLSKIRHHLRLQSI